MQEFMKYGTKIVTVKPITREEFDILVLDAKRILGQEPAKPPKPTTNIKPRREPEPEYLSPPANTGPYLYADRILALEWPVVRVWGLGLDRQFVNLADLRQVDDLEEPSAICEYEYAIKSSGNSSTKYGPCQVCGQHAAEVCIQTEYRLRHRSAEVVARLSKLHNRQMGAVGRIHEGMLFGHEACLLANRKD